MKVYKNDVVDWVVAASPEDAFLVVKEATGEDYLEDYDGIEWSALEEDHEFTVTFECPHDVPEAVRESGVETADGMIQVTLPAGEWVECGRGFLGSTEF